jgi:hypothetical protein
VTHLDVIAPAAASSRGSISLVRKAAVQALWKAIIDNLIDYRERWSVDDVQARKGAAVAVIPNLPSAGWLTRALDSDEDFIDEGVLLREWP